jgi:hypothetical protein
MQKKNQVTTNGTIQLTTSPDPAPSLIYFAIPMAGYRTTRVASNCLEQTTEIELSNKRKKVQTRRQQRMNTI